MTKEKKIFLLRLFGFALCACILPFAFIAWRYELFSKVDKISLSGWGLIGVIIVAVFVLYVIRTFKRGLKAKHQWSMTMQIVNGVLKVVLPLVALYFVINAIESSIELFKQSLLATIICEICAVPLNPLPKWEMESHIEHEDDLFEKLKNAIKEAK